MSIPVAIVCIDIYRHQFQHARYIAGYKFRSEGVLIGMEQTQTLERLLRLGLVPSGFLLCDLFQATYVPDSPGTQIRMYYY